MAGLDPAIHVFLAMKEDVDARRKAGYDGSEIGTELCHTRSIAIVNRRPGHRSASCASAN
jgi:hypothetical protein